MHYIDKAKIKSRHMYVTEVVNLDCIKIPGLNFAWMKT